MLERVNEIRSGKADDLDDELMEEGRRLYAKENGEDLEKEKATKQSLLLPGEDSELEDQAENKIILDLPDDDD